MKKKEFYKELKKHPELFDANKKDDAGIDMEDIPPIPQWFYDIKEEERRKKTRKFNKRMLVAVPACAVVALLLIVTPIGKSLAEGIYSLFVHWSERSVSVYYGESDNAFNAEADVIQANSFNNVDDVRKNYPDIIFAENNHYELIDTVKVAEHELEYNVKIKYEADGGWIKLENTYHKQMGERNFVAFSEEDDARPIDVAMSDGTPVVGYFDSEGGIATAHYDKLDVVFMTNAVGYDQFLEFIKTTTIQ